MRIAIIVHRLLPIRGGAETWTGRFIEWLHQQNHRVQLVTAYPPCQPVASFIAEHQVLPFRDRFAFATQVAALIDRTEVDVVHDMGYGYRCDLFQPHFGSQLAHDRAKVDCYGTTQRLLHKVLSRYGARPRRIRELMRRQYDQPSARYLAVSAKVARDIQKFHGVAPQRIDTITNGVDTHRFCPGMRQEQRHQARRDLNIGSNEMAILIVAHNHQLKGVPMLLQMLKLHAARSQKLHLLVVGGHHQRPRRINVNGNAVTFTGACDDVEMFYAAADVFALPTFYDACSLSVLEAMACELPVITTECNGASELIRDGVNGFVYDHPHNLTALWDRVVRCKDPDLRHLIGVAARTTAEQHPLTRNFAAIEAVYRQMAAWRAAAA